MKKIVFLVCLITFFGLSVIFTTANFTAVSFDYLLGTASFSLALLLYAALAIGLILGFLINLNILLRLRRENRQHRNEIELSRTELAKLRGIPYKDLP